MKRKAKRPAQSPNTMPPERLAPILDYLRQHAQTWDDAREAVAIRICHAFAETTLGNGIGILEADCIDDYLNETDPEYRRCRAQDEREHWENVLFQGHLENSLPRFNPFSAISFMDGAGRRFALPYYLLVNHLFYHGKNKRIAVISVLSTLVYLAALFITARIGIRWIPLAMIAGNAAILPILWTNVNDKAA